MTRYFLFLLRCIALAWLIVVASLGVAAAEEVDPTNLPSSDRSGGFSVGRLGLFSGEYGYTHLGEKYAFGDTTGQDVLTLPQRRYLHAYCVRLDESIVPAGTCDAHAMTEEQIELLETQERLESYVHAGGYALQLLNFSVEQSNTCLACPFMSNFLIGLANFSYAVNAYFLVAFQAFAPIELGHGAGVGEEADGLAALPDGRGNGIAPFGTPPERRQCLNR